MRATHYQKRNAICKKDLIVGLDIGSRFHAVVIQDKNGQIIKSYEIHFIRTTAVKSQRELDDSSSSKNDLRDAKDIARNI